EAYLRRRDVAGAAAVVDSLSGTDSMPALVLAATRIASNREAEAIAALDAALAKDPEDAEARWLLLHAMYSQIVRSGQGPRERFAIEARRYIGANGRHAALAADWLAMLSR